MYPVHIHDLILLIPEECINVAQKINVALELADVKIILYLAVRWIYCMVKMGTFFTSIMQT